MGGRGRGDGRRGEGGDGRRGGMGGMESRKGMKKKGRGCE